VRDSVVDRFDDVPTDIEELYGEPFLFFRRRKMQGTSVRTLEALIAE